MNEFIVWDEEDNVFVELENHVENNGFLDSDSTINEKIASFLEFYYGCKTFDYIEKKDINDKKIYADCSIVEFVYGENSSIAPQVMRGVFVFDEDKLCYSIKVIGIDCFDKPTVSYIPFWSGRVGNIKIIGTLQKNPELLT